MNIAGKTVVITGAARGIGFATAKALLQKGARVVIGDRDVAIAEAAVAELNRFGRVTGHPLDVTDPDSFAAFIGQARADGGGAIDVLINNAGVMPVGPVSRPLRGRGPISRRSQSLRVLTGCRLVLPEMVERRRGQIINIASVAGVDLRCRARLCTRRRSSRSSGLPLRCPTSSRRRASKSAAYCRHSPIPTDLRNPRPRALRNRFSRRISPRRSSRPSRSRKPL